MKLSTSACAVALLASLGLPAIAVAQGAPPTADFGSPPSGEVPILYNDRHVYAKPDRLRAGRVLAAIVRGQTILVPMRSLFEQMGATTTYDAATKTVDVSKAGADVKVTVGKAEVVINGESRPLDVPPEIYKGTVVVPLRVISEGMGAYVQWIPEKRIVVVRYLTAPVATPPPAVPAPPATPAPAPPPTPTAAPKRPSYERFVVGDYIIAPKVYNELSPGKTGKDSFHLAAAAEFPLLGPTWMLEADFRSFEYDHDGGLNTALGNQGSVFVPSFRARDEDATGASASRSPTRASISPSPISSATRTSKAERSRRSSTASVSVPKSYRTWTGRSLFTARPTTTRTSRRMRRKTSETARSVRCSIAT